MFRSVALGVLGLALAIPSHAQQPSDPVVARIQMKLTLGEMVLDTIEKGDLLTVLNERETSLVIQTFSGQKGAVAKVNVASLAEATEIYDELIKASPAEGRLYTLRASTFWASGETDKALEDYDKAIELGYSEAHAYSSRGLFHSAIGNHDQAIADFTEAVKLDENDDVPLVNRASVYMSTGQYGLAVADYDRAARLRPDNPTLYAQRAVANKLLGELEAAVADYDKAIELNQEDVSAWMGRGFVKFQLGRHRAAIEDFDRVIELSPQTAVAYNNRGYNYQQLGQHELALADFRRATELAPRYLLALQNIGWLLTICEKEDLRDPQGAIQAAKAVCEITDYKQLSDVMLLAAAHASAGEFAEAIGWQEKAIALAGEEQKPVAQKILALYQDEKRLDPSLLEEESSDE